MKNKRFRVYKTTNLINGRIYIRQSTLADDKWDDYLGSGAVLKQAVEKYGIKQFSEEMLLEGDNQDDLNEAEIFFIKAIS